MCQQQQNDMNSQIEIFLENGMPRKFGKSVAKTLKKRAAAAASRNNNNRAVNCKKCGGFFNSNNNDFYENQCVCSGDEDSTASCSSSAFSSTSPSSDEDDNNLQSKSSSHSSSISDDDSDESLVDSDTGFRSSRRKSSSRTTTARTGCPMAALFAAKNKILNTESQTSSPMKSLPSASDLQHVSTASGETTFKDDLLAISTKLTRKAFSRVDQILSKVQKSKTYRILSRTTQPAHVIAISIVSFVMLAVWPTLLENEEAAINGNKRRSGLALVTYLGAFATHFGAQIWMTFVSGLALYFALPRHTFGLCQQILFPKYFAMNSMLSILTLILFCKVIAGRWEFSSYVQVIALSTCAIIEVTVRLYLAPPLLRLMREKHKFEVTVGSGTEIGTLEPGDLVKCPHYQGIHKAFRRIHMAVAMGNMTVLVCTFMHLHYLASKLSV